MFDDPTEEPGRRIFRAALPGWQSAIPRAGGESNLYAPGRGWLELSILFAATAILIPAVSIAAAVTALAARRGGNLRWRAALAAAVWCGLLGMALRAMLGISLVP